MQFTLARARTSIQLGQELGRGGEGAVFAIVGRKDQVAKLYFSPIDFIKAQKLSVMAETASPSLLNVAAWPVDLLCDHKGVAHGFIMPRVVSRRNIHELYSPKSRADAFPEVDFRFLVHVAANIARAFAVVHEQGHIVGDVNHGNLLVGADGTVMLIDCDSFQIGSGTNIFTSDVGVQLFTAPELQGRAFRGLVRSPNHDRFGLAILLFHLLYMGRHPFAGRYIGQGDMPIEKAISEYRFAYGPDRAAKGMERPPGTLPLETMGVSITQLFIKAFGRIDTNNSRPDEYTWVEALEKLKSNLCVCSHASWHYHPVELESCPWCKVESQTGAHLFGRKIVIDGPIETINPEALWRAIFAIPDPGEEPTLPSKRPWQPPQGIELPSGRIKIFRKVLSIAFIFIGLSAFKSLGNDAGVIVILVSFGLAIAIWPWISAEKRAVVDEEYSTASKEWEGLLDCWRREASREVFFEMRDALENAYRELIDLPNKKSKLLGKLEKESERNQRRSYLDRFRIDHAKIPGIGPSRCAMLSSYGIETAADITNSKIMQIPGFGPTLTSELVDWRQGHEKNFRFNPKVQVNSKDIQAINQEIELSEKKLLSTLQQGLSVLRRLNQDIKTTRSRMIPLLEKAWDNLKIAEIRRNAL